MHPIKIISMQKTLSIKTKQNPSNRYFSIPLSYKNAWGSEYMHYAYLKINKFSGSVYEKWPFLSHTVCWEGLKWKNDVLTNNDGSIIGWGMDIFSLIGGQGSFLHTKKNTHRVRRFRGNFLMNWFICFWKRVLYWFDFFSFLNKTILIITSV